MTALSGLRSLALVLATLIPLTACSLLGEEDDPNDAIGRGRSTVVLLTHESFVLPDELIAQFEKDTEFDLEIRASGDAGTLTNKLVLSAGNPQGDVAFGVDNTFASRALENDVFTAYSDSPQLPPGARRFQLPGDTEQMLAPIDNASVCVNVDTTWFAKEGLTPPKTLDDLVDPAYRDLFVLPGAASSSPGMAFLLATIAQYGDDWPDYWTRLLDNGAKLTAGWTDAYTVDFTQGGGNGKRPIVLSYDSSPAFTIDGDRSTTEALLDTCFQQVEYAGVLAGADNFDGAHAVVSWLLSDDVQAALPESMYVFPVDRTAKLPADWASYAVQPDEPLSVDPAEIAEHRDEWLTTWSDVTSR